MGLDNSNHSRLSCDLDSCHFSMWKDLPDGTRFNLGKNHQILTKNCTLFSEPDINEENPEDVVCLTYHIFTDSELEILMDQKIVEKLKDYANVSRERESRQNIIRTDRVGEGSIKIDRR